MVQYILESAFCLACLYGFYWLALQRETFFQWNRLYLLLAPVLSLLLPALKIQLETRPALEEVRGGHPAAPIDLPVLVEQAQAAPVAVRHTLTQSVVTGWSLSLAEILWWGYLLGAGLLALRLSVRMWYLWRMIRHCRKSQAGDVEVAVSDMGVLPLASFFGYIFWNDERQLAGDQRLLLEHELVHVRQWHSLDVLLMEAMVVVYWFNPLMHAFRRSLCAVHEYIADDHVVRLTRQRYEYASLLVRYQKRGQKTQPGLVNTFHSLIKSRLVMLAKRPSRPFNRAKYALALPLFVALMLLFSFRLIEKTSAAASFRAAIQTVENYASTLDEVVVIAEKTTSPEPMPYNFYWGSIQCKIYHEPDSDTYFGEAAISPEEFRECLKREPRIWNGQSLEQYVSLKIGDLNVLSNYNDESFYLARRKDLEDFVAALQKDETIELEKVSLPNGKTATIRLSLGAAVAKWLPRNAGEINAMEDPAKIGYSNPASTELRWGGVSVGAKSRQFFTVGEFWDIVQNDPEIVFSDGRVQETDSLSLLAAIPGESYSMLLPIPADGQKHRFTIAEVRAKLESVREKIRPGVVVRITHGASRLMLFGVAAKGEYAESYFTLVPDGDPRLPLLRSDRSDFVFEWGNFSRKFPLMYARSFSSATESVHADQRYSIESTALNAKEILQMLRLTPRLYREKQILEQLSFTIKYLGRIVKVQDGKVPADFLAFFEQNVKDHDLVVFSDFQAHTGATRQMLQQAMKDAPDTWFQQGDINLSNVDIRLDVKSAESKPPLPVSEYMLQWGNFIQGLGSRGVPGAIADTLIFPLYTTADLKTMLATKPRILRNETPASRLQLQLRCGNLKTTVAEGGVNEGTLKKLNKKLDDAEFLWLSGFIADGIAPHPVVMQFRPNDLFVGSTVDKSRSATPPLRFSVNPNPARDKVTFQLDLPQAGKGRLSIANAMGQVVYALETDFSAGEGTHPVLTRDLKSTGTFFATLEMPYGKATQQFIVQ